MNSIEKPGGGSRLVGDVDFEGAKAVAGAITPVPGGYVDNLYCFVPNNIYSRVGPMTIACLLR